MKTEIKEKKSFYKVRQFRLSDKNYEQLKKIKRGTWNYTFNNLIKKYEQRKKSNYPSND